jgi:1,4-alpha-glucan branching enzyme
MKKIILRLVLFIDIVFMVILLVHLGQRIFSTSGKESPNLEKPESVLEKPEVFEKTESTKGVTETSVVQKKKRNIRFKHWAPQAKKAEIVGDFNNWIPTAMAKGENQHWVIDYQLELGEYTYKFLVDGRLKKDPYNPKSVPDGYGGESSLLIVKPLGEK